MATLTHMAAPARGPAAAPAFGSFWKVTQKLVAGLFHTALAAIYVSRGKRAERDIARYFADRGSPLTDSVEREIAARLLSSGWMRRD